MNRSLSMRMAVALIALPLVAAPLAAHADILIGIAGPMSGKDAAFGEEMRQGVDKAIADINAKGGLLGQQLRSILADDRCDPDIAAKAADALVAQRVAVVIGHFCSSASIAASITYAGSNLVEISPSSTNPEYTERGLINVFRVTGRDDAQGRVAADYLALNFRGKTFAVLDDKQTYGRGLAMSFANAMAAKGLKPVLTDEVDPGQQDFGDLIGRLAAAKVDIIYYGGYYAEAGLLVRQAHDKGLSILLVGGDGLNDPKFWSTAGDAGEGTLMTFGADPKQDPENAALVKYFTSHNYQPEGYTLYSYAALQVWADTVARKNSLDGAAVEGGLRTYQFQTTLGTLGFNAKGDRTGQSFVMYVWHQGQPIYVQRK